MASAKETNFTSALLLVGSPQKPLKRLVINDIHCDAWTQRKIEAFCYNTNLSMSLLDWEWGGLLITLLFLPLMRTDEKELDSQIQSHTPFAKPLFIWTSMGLVCVRHCGFYSSWFRIILRICRATERQTECVGDGAMAIHNWSSSQAAGLDSRGRSHSGRSHLIFSFTWFPSRPDTCIYTLACSLISSLTVTQNVKLSLGRALLPTSPHSLCLIHCV